MKASSCQKGALSEEKKCGKTVASNLLLPSIICYVLMVRLESFFIHADFQKHILEKCQINYTREPKGST